MKTAIIKTFHKVHRHSVYLLEDREEWHGTGHAPTYRLKGYEQFCCTTLMENGERVSVETWIKPDPVKPKVCCVGVCELPAGHTGPHDSKW